MSFPFLQKRRLLNVVQSRARSPRTDKRLDPSSNPKVCPCPSAAGSRVGLSSRSVEFNYEGDGAIGRGRGGPEAPPPRASGRSLTHSASARGGAGTGTSLGSPTLLVPSQWPRAGLRVGTAGEEPPRKDSEGPTPGPALQPSGLCKASPRLGAGGSAVAAEGGHLHSTAGLVTRQLLGFKVRDEC